MRIGYEPRTRRDLDTQESGQILVGPHINTKIRVGEYVEMGRPIHECVNAASRRIQCVECVGYTLKGLGG